MGDVNNFFMLDAVRAGNVKKVQQLIGCYSLSHCKSWSKGYVLLREATRYNRTEVAKLLLRSGSEVEDDTNKVSVTPLHFAAKNGNLEVVKMLVDRVADVDIEANDGTTPLFIAVKYGHFLIAEHLLSCGASSNIACTSQPGRTPLHAASIRGNKELVELLLSSNAQVNAKDLTGFTSLHCAIASGHSEIIEQLLVHGADINCAETSGGRNGDAPLHIAVKKNDDKIIELLLENGSKLDATNGDDSTPLHVAVKNNCETAVRILLKHEAAINAINKDSWTPLHIAVQNNHPTIVMILLEHGANVNATTKDNTTPLYIAIHDNFLPHGTLKSIPDVTSECFTVSERVIENSEKVVKFLLNYGANIDVTGPNNLTLLHIAVQNHAQTFIKLLLEYGANVNAVGKNNEAGRTVLHIASQMGNPETVDLLLRQGADINIMTKNNHSPLDFAIDRQAAFVRDILFMPTIYLNNYMKHGSYGKVIKYLQWHIIQLRAANLYLNEKNISAIDMDERFEHYRNKCEVEIANMKSEKITHNISFYDILTKGINQIAVYARNKNISQVFETDKCKTKFPIYADMIDLKFKKAIKRNYLEEKSDRFFLALPTSLPVLPINCNYNIYSYLSDEDLENLINACWLTDICKQWNISS